MSSNDIGKPPSSSTSVEAGAGGSAFITVATGKRSRSSLEQNAGDPTLNPLLSTIVTMAGPPRALRMLSSKDSESRRGASFVTSSAVAVTGASGGSSAGTGAGAGASANAGVRKSPKVKKLPRGGGRGDRSSGKKVPKSGGTPTPSPRGRKIGAGAGAKSSSKKLPTISTVKKKKQKRQNAKETGGTSGITSSATFTDVEFTLLPERALTIFGLYPPSGSISDKPYDNPTSRELKQSLKVSFNWVDLSLTTSSVRGSNNLVDQDDIRKKATDANPSFVLNAWNRVKKAVLAQTKFAPSHIPVIYLGGETVNSAFARIVKESGDLTWICHVGSNVECYQIHDISRVLVVTNCTHPSYHLMTGRSSNAVQQFKEMCHTVRSAFAAATGLGGTAFTMPKVITAFKAAATKDDASVAQALKDRTVRTTQMTTWLFGRKNEGREPGRLPTNLAHLRNIDADTLARVMNCPLFKDDTAVARRILPHCPYEHVCDPNFLNNLDSFRTDTGLNPKQFATAFCGGLASALANDASTFTTACTTFRTDMGLNPQQFATAFGNSLASALANDVVGTINLFETFMRDVGLNAEQLTAAISGSSVSHLRKNLSEFTSSCKRMLDVVDKDELVQLLKQGGVASRITTKDWLEAFLSVGAKPRDRKFVPFVHKYAPLLSNFTSEQVRTALNTSTSAVLAKHILEK